MIVKKLTATDRRKLCRDYVRGTQPEELAARYGVSIPTVTYHLKRQGVYRTIYGKYSDDEEVNIKKAIRRLARSLRKPPSAVASHIHTLNMRGEI